MMGMKDGAKRVLPVSVWRQLQDTRHPVQAYRRTALRRANASQSAADVFSDVYKTGQWGRDQEFDSGYGSRDDVTQAYKDFARSLIKETGARRAVDIGCGDFRVAAGFVDSLELYIGIDVVPSLIERNIKEFGRPGVQFQSMDAAAADMPDADICFIRQVLQHLSNAEIDAILTHCAKYPVVVVTEEWPPEEYRSPRLGRIPNRDKPHGGDTRIEIGSWVDISLAPFSRGPVVERLFGPVDETTNDLGLLRTLVWYPPSS
jgi:SAM-dependent methyltransferase